MELYLILYSGATGLEPAASAVTGQRSNQTELRPQLYNIEEILNTTKS